MKKLSIVLALIMALSCFAFVASADNEKVDIAIKVIYLPAHEDGSYHDSSMDPSWVDSRIVTYTAKAGTSLSAKDILTVVSNSAVNENGKPVMLLDGKEFVLNEKVFHGDVLVNGNVVEDVVLSNSTAMTSITLEADYSENGYGFICYAAEIDDVDNFAEVAASELGGYNWAGVANANVTLINEIIKGFKAAVDSVIKDTGTLTAKNATEKATAAAGSKAVATSPATGTSAVAGVAVVVLALATTVAVVARKKEDE